MTTKRYLCVLLCLTSYLTYSSGMMTQVRKEEYLGCFTESEESRVFSSGPGDYDPHDISPIRCLEQCGIKYKYAALQDGRLCLCSNTLPGTPKLDDSECNTPCPGSSKWPSSEHYLKCGGPLKNSVYNAGERILGFTLQKIESLNILEPVNIHGGITNGINVSYVFDLGDGTLVTKPSSEPKARHIYDKPGSYVVTATASNIISGEVVASEVYNVDDPRNNIRLTCPRAAEVGQIVECNGTMDRGSRVNSTFVFSDGRTDRMSISSRYYSAGTIVPRGNDSSVIPVLNTPGTILIPAYEFQHDGQVTHWDFEIVKKGTIKLMILRPECSAGEEYCTSTRSCKISSSSCLPLKQKKCSSDEMFCMIQKRCVSNAYTTTQDANNNPVKVYTSSSTCPIQAPYQWSEPRADYRILFVQEISLETIGHHISAIPLAQQPFVKEGDILGWLPVTGYLAYKSVADHEGASFEYSSGVSAVNDKLLRSGSTTLHQKHFVFAAHYAHVAKFVVRNRFGTPGLKSLTSNITEPLYLYIDYPIRNVTFEASKFANTNDSVEFLVPEHPGTNTTYFWDFGNGESLYTHLPSISYAFPTEGVFYVSLRAENSISHTVLTFPISIFDPILELEYKSPIKANALGTETLIEWKTSRGTNITFVVDFGDATPRYTAVTTLSGGRAVDTRHTYSAVGNYTVTVYAFNRVGPNITLVSYAVVEVPLEGLEFSVPNPHITKNIYLAAGDTMTVSRHYQKGTNIKCSCDFRDGTPPVLTTSQDMSHTYTNAGTYHVEITCFNDVNSITKPLNGTVVVQELQAITGLTVLTSATKFGTRSELLLEMATGSVFVCEWDFGDGNKTSTDFSFMGQTMYYTYVAVDTYNVAVTCTNRVGSVTARAVAPVDIPIDGVIISNNKRYIKVGEPVRLDVTVQKGTRMVYTVSYGDASTGSLSRDTAKAPSLADHESFTHAYATDGSYTVKVNVSNSYGWKEETLGETIMAQYPVEGIILRSNSPVRLSSGNVTYFISVLEGANPPTGAYAVWSFGDNSSVTTPEPIYDLRQKTYMRSHRFMINNTFTTTVNISNQVSHEVLAIDVRIQMLVGVIITPLLVTNATLFTITNGYGPEMNYFEVNKLIAFTSSSQLGDRTWAWEFGDGASTNVSSIPTSTHTFNTSGTYAVRVVVNNFLDVLEAEKTVFIQDPVGNVTLSSQLPTYYREPTVFNFQVTSRGSQSCLKLSLGDNNGAIFGQRHCRPSVMVANVTFIPVPENQTSFNYSYMYIYRGNYSVELTLWNFVSSQSVVWPIEIADLPCDYPIVRIDSEGTKTSPRKVKKSEPLVLPADVRYKCPVGKRIIFSWKAYEVTLLNPDDESRPFNLPVNEIKTFDLPARDTIMDAGSIKIKERTFPFITLKFTLEVGFVGSDRDLTHFTHSHSVWIEVEKSLLYAVIRGGQRKSVGYEMDMLLDGSESKDPDNPTNTTGIVYTWWCRRDEESFPSAFDAPNPTGGCYGNGNYQLNGSTSEISVYTGAFLQNAVYVFRIKVVKEEREAVFDQYITILPGQPPTMNLKCNFNCLAKTNPIERLVMETTCQDCKPTDILGYEWSLHRLLLGKDPDQIDSWETINPTSWAVNTSTGIDKGNLVINSHFLEPSRSYFLRLNAWKPGGYPGGFVEHRFTVNIAPTSGSCSVDPLEGFALDTTFQVKCDGWDDPDTPLKYLVELRNGADIVPISDGFEPYTSAVFPLGKEENNYTLTVNVKVMDKFFLDATTKFSVRVTEPITIDYNEVGGSVASAAGSGNAQEATQVTNAVCSVLNAKACKEEDDPNAKDARADFRGEVAKSMSTLPVDSFDGAAQKGEALNGLTAMPDEIKEDAQEAVTDAMNEIGDFLTKDNSGRNLDNTAKSLISGIGNIVGASSNTAKKALNSTCGDPSKSTNNTKKALDLVEIVSSACMKQLVAGDKPKAIKTDNIDLAIGRKDLSDLANDDEDESEGDTGGFSLPDPAMLFGGANASTEEGATSGIGSTMTAMGDNPFPGGSDDLNSKTIGLSLTDGNGNPLDLAGQTLEMYVPRDLKKNPLKPMELNHFGPNDPVMRVHKFNRTTNLTAIAVEIQPFDPQIKFRIHVRFETRPSATHFHWNHTFPSLEEAAKMKRRPHPFTFVINHVVLRDTLLSSNASDNGTVFNSTMGSYFLGIKAINKDSLSSPNTSYAMRIYLPACKSFDEDTNTWTTNGCVVGNKTRANITHCVCRPGEDEPEDMDPTAVPPGAAIGNAASSTGDDTSSGGPVRVRRFKRKKVFKLSLASSFFPAPNPIDFDKVFANVNFAENPIALSVVLSIFGVYLILAIYSRREDKKDIERAGVTPLEDNDPSDRYHYEITVYTGFGKKAATTAQVSFILAGDEGEGEPRILKDPKRKTFQRRGIDVFLATYPESLGEINYLHIWHDNTGRSPSWYLSRVMVEDINNDKKYMFINESWLAVEEGDGTVDRLIPVAGKDEMTSFNHLFYSTTQKNLADGHLWFSIFMRPARSRFTRLQRVSCCLTLLYCSMLANAMFYNIGGETDPSQTLQIGPLAFSPAQVGIGIMSSLVIVPVNIFLVAVFRGVEPMPTPAELKERKSRKYWWFYEIFFCFFDRNPKKNDFIQILHKNHKPDDFLDLSSSSRTNLAFNDSLDLGLGDDDINFRISKQEKREEMEKKQKKKKKKKKQLPYWFLYIAWVVCGLTCFTCSFFVVLYGLQFGHDKSAQWISSMLVSFFQDVLVSQPIKVVAIALIIAAIIKKPPEEEDDGDKKKLEDEDWMHDDGNSEKRDKRMRPKGLIRLKPPNKEKLEKDRQQRFKEMKMSAMIKEVTLYTFFVACLCIVSYSHRDPTSFQFRQSMYNTFVSGTYGGVRSFDSIGSRENFYDWAKTTLMTSLFKNTWYNGNPYDVGFTGDGIAYVVGGARMRQLRVEKHSCEVPYQFNKLVHNCKTWYGFFAEDTGQYDIAWEPLKNESLYKPPFTFKSWEFYESAELDSMPFMAYVSSYGGGGYAAELGQTEEHALRVIKTLENNTWIDSQTRAVFTEVSTYNPVSNLFCAMTFVVEFLPTNGVYLYMDLKVSRLFATGGGFETFLVVCEFLVVVFFLIFIYQELKQLYRMRKAYFKDFWNNIEFTMVILVLASVCMFLMRLKLVESALTKLEKQGNTFVSFSRVSSWSEAFMIVVALLVFTTWLKGIKLLRFNPRILMLTRTLKGAAGPLATFSVVFLVFFMSYALFAFAVFGKDIQSFYNFVTTAESVMGLLLGSFDYGEIEEAQPILGPIFFFTFMVFGNFIIMNMFLTIIMDVFAEVKEQLSEQNDSEFEVVEFMVRRFRKFTGMQPNKVNMEDAEDKKEMEERLKEDMTVFKVKKKKNRHRKLQPMDLVAQRFSRLDDSLKGFCCDEWAEERMLDDIVERKWGINTDEVNRSAQCELKHAEQQEAFRLDMYAALDNYEASPTDEDAFTFSFPDGEFKRDLSEA
ncbi:polycystic kidney disease and receptor for egg jelly-related protein [Nematostella vectensis]|uniref:polycystic kidney disease and receptor for egg jelly-related protein n=1 Tax=Nematostella vectensis TaxID=45351 RepID=UPI002076FB2E|nr:polycystic kidney disease and receptor for egg jelly-related protein [Nematostella vectensis]